MYSRQVRVYAHKLINMMVNKTPLAIPVSGTLTDAKLHGNGSAIFGLHHVSTAGMVNTVQ